MDELYLDNIDEFVHDHNKIVTYKWLSLTLGVHVNQAKQMLYHYLDQKRKENSGTQLHATYLVSGKHEENGNRSHKVAVVREEQLEEVKSKMALVVSVHVYSIQKARLRDSAPLYNTDYDAVKENLKNCCRYSGIRCPSAEPLSPEERRLDPEPAQAAPTEPELTRSVPNRSAPPASKMAAKQPKGIMGMFSNKSASKSQEGSKQVKTEGTEDTATTETAKTKPAVKANAMNNFFGKTTSTKAVKEESAEAQASRSAEAVLSRSPAKAEVNIKEEPKSSEAAGAKHKMGNSKTKRLELSGSEEERVEVHKKKRRRIKKAQLESSDEDDEVIPDSPPARDVEQPAPSPESKVKKEPNTHTQVSSEGRRRKRRRVLKPHTFVDEEGCIVTEKRYESESYSESDDDFKESRQTFRESASLRPAVTKKEEEGRSQKKASVSASKSTKQPSIMGFFQKK